LDLKEVVEGTSGDLSMTRWKGDIRIFIQILNIHDSDSNLEGWQILNIHDSHPNMIKIGIWPIKLI